MRSLNPFKNVPTIMTADEILEYAHFKSKRTSMKSSFMIPKLDRTRIREVKRLQEFIKHVKIKLREAVEDFPSIDRLHPFYLELTEILIGTDKLKKALGSIYNCIPPIDEVADNHLEALKLTKDFKQMKWSRSAAKGRISSIVRATSNKLDFIIESKITLAKLPGIIPDSPTIVCAGFPNVGKSTLVRHVSTAEPEIAYYPFTTKEIIIGHLKIDTHSVQIVDTPGVLDRPMGERNEIERQAITALKYLSHVIIFIIDPSEACGWALDEQINFYREVRRMFPILPILVAMNKMDIAPEDKVNLARKQFPEAYEIIATEGTGVQELLRDAIDEVDLTSMQESVDAYVASLTNRETNSFD